MFRRFNDAFDSCSLYFEPITNRVDIFVDISVSVVLRLVFKRFRFLAHFKFKFCFDSSS